LCNNKYSHADVQFFSITICILALRDVFIQNHPSVLQTMRKYANTLCCSFKEHGTDDPLTRYGAPRYTLSRWCTKLHSLQMVHQATLSPDGAPSYTLSRWCTKLHSLQMVHQATLSPDGAPSCTLSRWCTKLHSLQMQWLFANHIRILCSPCPVILCY